MTEMLKFLTCYALISEVLRFFISEKQNTIKSQYQKTNNKQITMARFPNNWFLIFFFEI